MNIKSLLKGSLVFALLASLCTANNNNAYAFDSSANITVISREDGSGTRGAFVELFDVLGTFNGKKADLTTLDAQITNSTAVMMTGVAGDEYAIGYTSLGALNDSVKAVKIDNAVPNSENIQNGSYTISRPFNIASLANNTNPVAKDFIAFILSPMGQEIVAKNGYIPVANVAEYKNTSVQGKAIVGGSSSVAPVMEKLAEAYKKQNPKASIELQVNDSTTGMISTLNGSYDIGLASRELKKEEKEKGLIPLVIASDGIAIIVNKNNPIENLSKAQVKEIYLGNIQNWDALAN